MSTQYDAIGGSRYEEMKKLAAAQLQEHSFTKAVAPYAKGARVLDLACGTGHYSRVLLEMGAACVVGVDISKVMVEAAKASSTSDRLNFQVGDCSKPAVFDGGPFDLVIGVWLLNYAPSAKAMVDMFRNVSMNLKDGGYFVGVTPHPTNDPKTHVEETLHARPPQYGHVAVLVSGEVEDGIATHVISGTGPGTFEFDAYHLTKDVYVAAAREGGMKGRFIWKPTESPEGEASESWESYFKFPHFGILEVAKS